jgi:hypothetical protein
MRGKQVSPPAPFRKVMWGVAWKEQPLGRNESGLSSDVWVFFNAGETGFPPSPLSAK